MNSDRRWNGRRLPALDWSRPAGPPTAAAVARLRPIGPVAKLLLNEAWRLRLKLSDFNDIEDPNDPDGPLRDRAHDTAALPGEDIRPGIQSDARAEYYRRVGVESHRKPPRHRSRVVAGGLGIFPISAAVDKKILRMHAEGTGRLAIMAALHVGTQRYYRVLRQVNERIRREMQMGNKDKQGTQWTQEEARRQQAELGQANISAQQAANVSQALVPPAAREAIAASPPAVPAMVTRALTDPAGLAREYATAAAEILAAKQLQPQSRKDATRLLRLAMEMLGV